MEMNGVRGVNSEVPGLAEISRSYMNDFIAEIREILEKIEIELVDLEVDPGNPDHLDTVYNSFNTIRGLAGLLHDPASIRIAAASGELLETLRKYGASAGKSAINLLLFSVRFIRRICEDSDEVKDTLFMGEVEQHINNIRKLREDIILEIRQPAERDTRIGEILVAEGALERSDVEDVLKKQSSVFNKMKFGEIILKEKKVDVSRYHQGDTHAEDKKCRNLGSVCQNPAGKT